MALLVQKCTEVAPFLLFQNRFQENHFIQVKRKERPMPTHSLGQSSTPKFNFSWTRASSKNEATDPEAAQKSREGWMRDWADRFYPCSRHCGANMPALFARFGSGGYKTQQLSRLPLSRKFVEIFGHWRRCRPRKQDNSVTNRPGHNQSFLFRPRRVEKPNGSFTGFKQFLAEILVALIYRCQASLRAS